jgi:hypothetical protein
VTTLPRWWTGSDSRDCRTYVEATMQHGLDEVPAVDTAGIARCRRCAHWESEDGATGTCAAAPRLSVARVTRARSTCGRFEPRQS